MTRKRTVSDRWGAVFKTLINSKAYENGIDVNALLKVAESLGVEITRESARVKLHRYADRGYMIKVRRGVYAISPDGLRFFKLKLFRPKEKFAIKKNSDWDDYVNRNLPGGKPKE